MFTAQRPGPALVSGSLLFLMLGAGCGGSTPQAVSVPLHYMAAGDASEAGRGVAFSPGLRLYVEPMEDGRDDRSTIGANAEDGRHIPVYSTGETPAQFVEGAIRRELAHVGFPLTAGPEGATRTLSVKLVKFFVLETGTYEAEINAMVQVTDPQGKVLFTGLAIGSKKQWGKSLSSDNYREVLSKATQAMVGDLFANPNFQRALGD
jgi:hypothetical protein